jgi:acylphosphatase
MVQGVGYRYFAQRTASRLGLSGYTKNLRDGRVEVYAIGPVAAIAKLRQELERGPDAATVSGVVENDAPLEAKYEKDFSIEYDA